MTGFLILETVESAILDTLDANLFTIAYRVVGLAFLSAVVAGASSFLFRWRTRTQLPEGPALLLGLGAVAVYLNTRIALVQFLGTDGDVLTTTAIVVNLSIFAASTITAAVGWQFGDRLGQSDRFHPSLHADFSPLVRATGRTVTVELPEEIKTIEGYDPVSKTVRESMAGESYSFPRRMTVEALKSELVTRLRTDYDIAHVDVELTVEGDVEFLAVGGRATGIGPTLPPDSDATAITADPAFSASAGDTVQIWDGDNRIGTAELRASAGRTVTVAGQPSLIEDLDPKTEYRLMTLPADERVDRLFAGMLRRADETMTTVTVREETTLAGMTVGVLGLPVVAVESADGTASTLPDRDRTIQAGETLFVIGHPTYLRRVETAAAGTEEYDPPTAAEQQAKKRRLWQQFRNRRN